MKILKILAYIFVGYIVISVIYGTIFYYSSKFAESNARKSCELAVTGMKFSDFEEDLLKNGIKVKPSPSTKNNAIESYLLTFFHLGFSGETCRIYVKDDIITHSITSIENDEQILNDPQQK